MKQIDIDSSRAFINRQLLKRSNTMVTLVVPGRRLRESYYAFRLFGNEIARWNRNGTITITDCGWETVTTKSRLNAILRTAGCESFIFQRNGEWYLQLSATKKIPWPGEFTFMPRTR